MSKGIRRTALCAMAGLAASCYLLTPGSTVSAATSSGLWPTFSTPQTLYAVDAIGASADDMLALTTLEGAYNQQQSSGRLYIEQSSDDQTWLQNAVPSGISVQTVPVSSNGDPLAAVLSQFGSAIRGAIVTDPSAPDSINVATTMAGIDDAMVITPSQESLVKQYNIPILDDLSTYQWVGPDYPQAYNLVTNPSGSSGTSGWTMAYNGQNASSTSATYAGASALNWQVSGTGNQDWISYYPSVQPGQTYVFSAEVAGSGTVSLDAWDGQKDNFSPSVNLTSQYQTVSLSVTMPSSLPNGGSAPQIQIRSNGGDANVYFRNAVVTEEPVALYAWAEKHLLPETNSKDLAMLPTSIEGALRDYIVASNAFVFNLTSTDSTQDALYKDILQQRPANTPIVGYIPNEGPDVATLSAAGHFLNASDYLQNASVWASMPSPSQLSQPVPSAIQAKPGTAYVAFVVSDGDNAQFVQHHMLQLWNDPNFGTLPMGWTMPPGMIDFAPTLMDWYYQHQPANSELLAGPSGVGYATQMTGGDLETFGHITQDYLQRDGMYTLDDWETPSTVNDLASSAKPLDISLDAPYAPTSLGQTEVFGQTSGYIGSEQELLRTIKQQVAGAPAGQPIFLEPLVDAWNLTPSNILWVAQQLADTGVHYVFTTPAELALTMKAYNDHQESGLPDGNALSLDGLKLPTQSATNLIANPSGATGTSGWNLAYNGDYANLQSTTYNGGPALLWNVTQGNLGHQDWVQYSPPVQPGNTYTFSVDVAGSGQAFLDVYDGASDNQTQPVTLTSQYQTLTLSLTVPANATNSPQFQLRESGDQPVSVYFKNATALQTGTGTGSDTGTPVPTGPNVVTNPSGDQGTQGWAMAYQGQDATLQSVPYQGSSTLKWHVNGGLDQEDWVSYYPTVTSGQSYTFSVDVAGTGQAFLDVWDGQNDNQSIAVNLSPAFQTLTMTIPIPANAPTPPSLQAPQLQVRVLGDKPTTVFFRNASVRQDSTGSAAN